MRLQKWNLHRNLSNSSNVTVVTAYIVITRDIETSNGLFSKNEQNQFCPKIAGAIRKVVLVVEMHDCDFLVNSRNAYIKSIHKAQKASAANELQILLLYV